MARIGDSLGLGLLDSRYVNVTGDTMTGGLTVPALTINTFASGGVLFAGVGGLISTDPGRFVFDPVTHRLGVGSTGSAQLHVDPIGNSAIGVHVDNEQDLTQDLYGYTSHVAQENTAGTRSEYGGKFEAESVSGTVLDSIGVWGYSNPNAKTGISAGVKGEGQTYGGYFISTGQALRIAYDASNYAGLTISSGGDLTIAPSGGDTTITGNGIISGKLGVGAAPLYGFYVERTSSDVYNAFLTYTYTGTSAGTKAALRNYVDVDSASDNSGNNAAFWNSVNVPASVTANFSSTLALVGSFYEAVHRGTGTVAGMVGVNANVTNVAGAGAITNFKGFRAQLTAAAGTTVTNFYGYEVDYNLTATVTSTNSYSFYSDANSQSTNDWGAYLLNTKNYIGGLLGVGIANPLEKVHVNGTGMKLVIDAAAYATSKFNSQGVDWASTTTHAIIFNDAAGNRPEISWIRGSRTYPEFSIRQHTTADRGGSIWSGAGTAAPTETMFFSLGNVGVGSGFTPTSLLHVKKDQDAITSVRVGNAAATSNVNAAAEVIMEAVDASGFFGAFHSGYTAVARYADKFVMGANSDASGIVINAAVSTQTAQFYIGSSSLPLMHMELSEVGINTITPQSALHVVKNTAGAMPTGIGGNVSMIIQNNDVDTRNNEIVLIGGSASGGAIINFTSDAGAYSAQGRIFYGTGTDIMTIWTAGAERVRIKDDGYVGIGSTNPTNRLQVEVSGTDPTGISSIYGINTATLTANSANIFTGITGDGRVNQATVNATATIGVRGVSGIARVSGASGTVTGAGGFVSSVINTGAGTVSNMYNFFAAAATNSGGGTVTNYIGFYAQANTIGTNIYGFHGNIAAAANRWNLYMLGTADNYLAGDLGVGVTTPASKLDVSETTGGIFTLSRNDTTVTSAEMIGKIQWWNNDSTLTTQNIYADIEVQATQDITTDAAAARMIFRTTGTTAGGSPVEAMRITQTQSVTFASATGGFGYGTGAGGTVTQLTNKATGVTLSKVTGQITMNNAALAGDTTVSFVLTNTAIAATDLLVLNHVSGGTAGSYLLNAQAGAGSATINVRNITTGSLSEAIVIGFAVIKAVTS